MTQRYKNHRTSGRPQSVICIYLILIEYFFNRNRLITQTSIIVVFPLPFALHVYVSVRQSVPMYDAAHTCSPIRPYLQIKYFSQRKLFLPTPLGYPVVVEGRMSFSSFVSMYIYIRSKQIRYTVRPSATWQRR